MKNLLITTITFVLLTNISFAEDWSWHQFTEEPMGTVHMEAEILNSELLKVNVIADEMLTPVLGLAFHLEYSDFIHFLRYDPGTFLERGGDPFYLVTDHSDKSKLIFGATLKREDSFPVGGGQIASFYFQINKQSDISLEFFNGVVSTLDVVRQDIDRILWQNLYLDENGKRLVNKPRQNTSSSSDKELGRKKYLLISIGSLAVLSLIALLFLLKQRPQQPA